jgi:hypothetical protein
LAALLTAGAIDDVERHPHHLEPGDALLDRPQRAASRQLADKRREQRIDRSRLSHDQARRGLAHHAPDNLVAE